MQNYKIDILTYNISGSVKSDCADIAFQNNGTFPVVLNNGYTLSPNSVLSFSANNDEIDRTIYTFTFPAGAGISGCNLTIIRKVYI